MQLHITQGRDAIIVAIIDDLARIHEHARALAGGAGGRQPIIERLGLNNLDRQRRRGNGEATERGKTGATKR